MADRFDVVAIEVAHERGVVARMILRAEARGAIVAPARSQSRLVERAHGGARLDHEREMQRRCRPAVASDPELRLAVLTEPAGPYRVLLGRDLHHEREAER